MMDPRHRLDAERLQAPFIDDHHAGSAVADLAGAGGGVFAVLRDQLDALDAVEAGIEADAFVDMVGVGRPAGAGDLPRYDARPDAAVFRCGKPALARVVGIV